MADAFIGDRRESIGVGGVEALWRSVQNADDFRNLTGNDLHGILRRALEDLLIVKPLCSKYASLRTAVGDAAKALSRVLSTEAAAKDSELAALYEQLNESSQAK